GQSRRRRATLGSPGTEQRKQTPHKPSFGLWHKGRQGPAAPRLSARGGCGRRGRGSVAGPHRPLCFLTTKGPRAPRRQGPPTILPWCPWRLCGYSYLVSTPKTLAASARKRCHPLLVGLFFCIHSTAWSYHFRACFASPSC